MKQRPRIYYTDIVRHDVDPFRIKTQADGLPHEFTGYRVAIAIQRHQTSTGDLAQGFDVTIERCHPRNDFASMIRSSGSS